MYIQKLKINNFKSFYDTHELDFSNVKGLWKVSGVVGSGKTSIGEAILFGLFGTINGKNNSDLVSWNKRSASVELWCNSIGRNLYIKRDIFASGQSTIYVEIDGEEMMFTNKRDAQQQLENEYFDVSKVTMELLCIISFNNFKSLATLNPADTKKFLDQVLGFYVLTDYTTICKELKQENESKLAEISRNISNISAQIDKLTEISNRELIDGDIKELELKISECQEQLTTHKTKHDNIINEFKKIDTNLKHELTKIKTLGAAKAKEIKFIENGICPTCGATIDQSQLEIKRQEREVLLNQYNIINDQITQNNAKQSTENIEYNELIKPINATIDDYKETVIKLKAQAKQKDVNQNEIDKLESTKELYTIDYNSCMADNMSWDRLSNVLSNDVRAKILDSFIPALNKNIMEYVQKLHQPYIIKFDNNFKCSISLCGYCNPIPISSLSTGQLKTVDMIIILGILGTVIGAASTNIIFLDELFSNLDTHLRNDMCSVLNNFISENDTMFVISHQELDERYFSGTMKMSLETKNQYEKHSYITLIPNTI